MPIGDVLDTPSLFDLVNDPHDGAHETVPTKIGPNELETALNVDLTEDGLVKKTLGYSEFGTGFDASAMVRHVNFFVDAGGNERLLAVENGKFWQKAAAGNWSSFASGFVDAHTRIIIGNDKAFFTSPSNNVQYWDGTTLTAFTNTNTDPPRAKHGIWMLGWLLLANDSAARDGIYFGTNGTPTAGWNRTTNVLKISQGDGGEIVGILQWTDLDFIVLKNRRIFRVTINGATPASWPVNALTEDIGCVNGAAVALGDTLFFLAEDGIRTIHITDNNVKLADRAPISRGRVDSTIRRINGLRAAQSTNTVWSTAVAGHDNSVVRFAVPFDTSTTNNAEICVDVSGGRLAFFTKEGSNIGGYSKAYFSSKALPVVWHSGATTPKVFKYGDTFNYDGVAMTWTIDLKGMDFQMPESFKIGGEVELWFNATGAYTITVQARTEQGTYSTYGTISLVGNNPTLPQTLPFSLGDGLARNKINLYGLGRYKEMQLRLTNSESGSEIEFIRAILRALPQEYSKAR